MTKPDLLLWCDLETSGTDERTDPILEVACLVTTADLRELCGYQAVIRPPAQVDELMTRCNKAVLRMHSDNGLWEACRGSTIGLVQAEQELLAVIGDVAREPADDVWSRLTLAGSGVSHFDRRFIHAQMPALSKRLAYYSIDVGVLRRVLPLIGQGDLVRPAPSKSHRAMDDVRMHLDEMRWYRDKFGNLVNAREQDGA